MGLIAEGVGHNGYGDGKGRWVGGVLESVQLMLQEKILVTCLGEGGKGANAGCSFFLGKINLSRGAWGEIVGDDSVDFAAKGLNSDWEGGSFLSSVMLWERRKK